MKEFSCFPQWLNCFSPLHQPTARCIGKAWIGKVSRALGFVKIHLSLLLILYLFQSKPTDGFWRNKQKNKKKQQQKKHWFSEKAGHKLTNSYFYNIETIRSQNVQPSSLLHWNINLTFKILFLEKKQKGRWWGLQSLHKAWITAKRNLAKRLNILQILWYKMLWYPSAEEAAGRDHLNQDQRGWRERKPPGCVLETWLIQLLCKVTSSYAHIRAKLLRVREQWKSAWQ